MVVPSSMATGRWTISLGRFLRLGRPRARRLSSAPALSQQPYLKAESTGGRHYYRIIGPRVFAERLGIESAFEYNPVMSDQAILRFGDEDEVLLVRAAPARLSRQGTGRVPYRTRGDRTGGSMQLHHGRAAGCHRSATNPVRGPSRSSTSSIPWMSSRAVSITRTGCSGSDIQHRVHVVHRDKVSILFYRARDPGIVRSAASRLHDMPSLPRGPAAGVGA